MPDAPQTAQQEDTVTLPSAIQDATDRVIRLQAEHVGYVERGLYDRAADLEAELADAYETLTAAIEADLDDDAMTAPHEGVGT